MEKRTKDYTVPGEVASVWIECTALLRLRDVYAKLPFGYKKAKRAGLEAQNARSKFWRMIRGLYPDELADKVLHYDDETQTCWGVDVDA